MEFFKHIPHIRFMKARKWTALVSATLIIISIISLSIKGLNLGLDFTGGVQVEVMYEQPPQLKIIREQLTQQGIDPKQVKTYGSASNIMIMLPLGSQSEQNISQQVASALPDAKIMQVSFVGPQVGKELATKGALAMLVSFLAILIYITFRFEYRFALSAILALIHDPIIIFGVFSLFHIEFDLISLVAVLTVIGYSLNDTIVVFDRVRENFRKLRKSEAIEVMDLSINQTLSRTVMTSGLTLLAVIALLIYGGPTLFGFSLALVIGIVVGTYSSIYIAGALAITMGLKRADFLPKTKEEVESRP